ncbi:MAG: hypothetical protein KC636_29600, partial [Myxococcales bacterium]|nr:hypothetical protein [Myxococcales bacterium]
MARRRALALAAATGLHLASLQLGYLLTIQMHLSSGYLSYALVTALWMLGCLIGLWVALPATLAVIAGLASYLVTLVACNLAPFHPSLLWLAIPAVIVSGLWAGRFFCVALARDDGEGASARAFAGENTGFVAGLVGVFLGYALLGRALLLWAPLVTGASVLALLSRRGPALALLGLVLGGCVDEGPSVVPAPDRSLFATQAYPILLRDCGFPGCHGAEDRYYQVFGPGRTRLAAPGEPPPGPFDLATPYELAR